MIIKKYYIWINLMHSNINNDSYQSLKKFRENQIKSNIRLHIIFIILIFIIDSGLLFFIFVYKSKISSIKAKSSENTSVINTNKDYIYKNNNLMTHQLVNILAQMDSDYYRFSLILEKSEDVQRLKNSIANFYKSTKNKIIDINKINMGFSYNAISESGTYDYIRDKLDMNINAFILIEGESKRKFGFFVGESIIFDKKGFQYKGTDCFLISFHHDGIFKCIGDKNKLSIKDENNLIVIGDDDIIIQKDFFTYEEKRGIINFPFKAIDVSTINENIFTPTNEKFHLMNMEIFSFYYI